MRPGGKLTSCQAMKSLESEWNLFSFQDPMQPLLPSPSSLCIILSKHLSKSSRQRNFQISLQEWATSSGKKNPFLLNHLENESWLWTVTDFSNFKCELRHLPTRTHRVMNMQREKLNKIHPKKMFCNAISITKTAFSPLHSSSRT